MRPACALRASARQASNPPLRDALPPSPRATARTSRQSDSNMLIRANIIADNWHPATGHANFLACRLYYPPLAASSVPAGSPSRRRSPSLWALAPASPSSALSPDPAAIAAVSRCPASGVDCVAEPEPQSVFQELRLGLQCVATTDLGIRGRRSVLGSAVHDHRNPPSGSARRLAVHTHLVHDAGSSPSSVERSSPTMVYRAGTTSRF